MGGEGGGGHEGPHFIINFVVIVPLIIKYGTGIKLNVFNAMVTKMFVSSLLSCNYDVITCILGDI